MTLQTILEELPALPTSALKRIAIEAERLMAQPKLYIRELGKSEGGEPFVLLVATWQEEGKTEKRILGRKEVGSGSAEFADIGIADGEARQFLQAMQAKNYRIVVA